MKSLFIALPLLFASIANITSKDPNDILGVWLMANKNVKVRIYKVEEKYFGKVVWMDTDANKKNFHVGGTIIDEMKYNPENNKYEGGHFYGRGYKLSCELELIEKDRIKVRVSKGFLYQTRYCTRVL